MFALALLAATACSSPTEPRLPQPNPDDDEDPERPGATAALELPDALTFI
jgi:hypothetical protein